MIGTATVPAAADQSASGLPQFDVGQWPGEMVWVLAIFLVLYLLFAFVFVPRVSETIDAREDRIGGEIGDARRLRNQAQESHIAAQRLQQRVAFERFLARLAPSGEWGSGAHNKR